jgi:four helix bundle protein
MPKLEDRNTKLGNPTLLPASRVRDFIDLQVWQLARELRKQLYGLMRELPVDERFALVQQLRRAATSITANIVEGFGRYSFQENIQFCRQARGSAYEVRDHLTTAVDQGYISPEAHQSLDQLAQRVIQTLNGYIRPTQARQKATSHRSGK